MRRSTLFLAVGACAWRLLAANAALATSDFNTWTLLEDPPNANLAGVVDSATQATLSASGAVPAGTDIGFASVDGAFVADSTTGHFLSIDSDFHVAIDFDVTAINSVGLAVIGLGVGEHAAGDNGAGATLTLLNGAPQAFVGAGRSENGHPLPEVFGPAAASTGRFFVSYEAASGDIVYGVSTTQGAAAPSHIGAFNSLQNSWNEKDLLVSFFLRSDTLPALSIPPLTSGTVDAVFSNFTVLAGAATSIPEPSALVLIGLSGFVALQRRKR